VDEFVDGVYDSVDDPVENMYIMSIKH